MDDDVVVLTNDMVTRGTLLAPRWGPRKKEEFYKILIFNILFKRILGAQFILNGENQIFKKVIL